MNKNILLVDDEELILKALRRVFLSSEYQIYLATSGKQALDILNLEKIDLMITDIKMPEMNGHQLLIQVKAEHPDVIRIVLSGYLDDKTVFKLIHNNLAKMCMFKPWDNKQMLKTIQQLFELNTILNNNSMLKTIKNMETLPTRTTTYHDLCLLIDAEASVSEIEQLLMKDQAIVAAILRIVNSAFFNIKTGSLKKAITYIGLSQLKNIAFVASISYKNKLKPSLANTYKLFSHHALLTNKICNLIFSEVLAKKVPPDSSCVGLLNEIGRAVLMHNYPVEYEKIISLAGKDHRPLYQIEKSILGVAHQEMSGYLLNWWGLPYSLVEAILYHHSPLDEGIINKDLASVIHLADFYASQVLCFPWSETVNRDVFAFLNVSQDDIEKIVCKVVQDSEEKFSTS